MKTKFYFKFSSAFTVLMFLLLHTAKAQNTFPSTGRVGIYTTSPAASLQVKGGARIGTLSNYVNIDSATGNLSFAGTSAYQVGGNKYAFQYTGNPNYGLFFNSSTVQYEFRNGSAAPVFSINANSGNGVFNGTLKIGAYTLPSTDGTSGQVLTTNGSGTVNWSTVSGGGSYTAGTGISISGNTITNTAPDKTVTLTGSGATTVSGTYPNFTISSTDNNTTYTAGTGISISGTTITNTAPNQTVTLTGGTGISVSGTYPSFTINNTSPQGWLLTGNAGTNPSTNFLGTTDAQPLVFRVNNVRAGYLDYDGSKANTAFGYQSLYSNTTGASNTAFGYESLYSNVNGSVNTAAGYGALFSNINGSYNTAIGNDALYYNSSGNSNTAIGQDALLSNTNGNSNTAIGIGALISNTTGSYNTATGDHALIANSGGINNTSNGFQSLYSNTTGNSNVAIGTRALFSNQVGSNLVAIGDSALYSNTGSANTAVGDHSLFSNNTGYANTATGYIALQLNSTGHDNTADGNFALEANTTGLLNTATGSYALYGNGTGDNNTAIGTTALYFNYSGSGNTATGSATLYDNFGSYNTGTGYEALFENLNGSNNTANGDHALYNNSSGSYNTAIGQYALTSNVSGIGNTGVGHYADVSGTVNYATAVGNDATVNATNKMQLGSSTATISTSNGYTIVSDGRFKEQIKTTDVPGLSFINKLRPVTYNFNYKKFDNFLRKDSKSDSAVKNDKEYQSQLADKSKKRELGFIAQEVDKTVHDNSYTFTGVYTPQNDNDNYALDYGRFVVPLVKAVQELSAGNDAKDAKIDTLQSQLNDLKTLVLSIQQKQDACSPCSAVTSPDAMQAQSFTTVLTDDASLQQNVPNPFSNTTSIGYTLPQKFTSAQIIIIDKNGKILKAVTVSGSGKGSLNVDASLLAAGAYQYSMVVDGRLVATKQMVLAR